MFPSLNCNQGGIQRVGNAWACHWAALKHCCQSLRLFLVNAESRRWNDSGRRSELSTSASRRHGDEFRKPYSAHSPRSKPPEECRTSLAFRDNSACFFPGIVPWSCMDFKLLVYSPVWQKWKKQSVANCSQTSPRVNNATLPIHFFTGVDWRLYANWWIVLLSFTHTSVG